MATPRRLHYVVSTHWDREWYSTFQDYRYRLVQLFDRVLDGLQAGEMAGPFTTDGQAVVLEDYLEVRPERRAQVEALARAGRLAIGPWYVMPDEFLVSGEALIRNLRLGRQMARAFGGQPSNAGFVCDIFGHNSQLPQIFAGFGIRGGLIWRGINQTERRTLLWRGADGTVLPSYRFGQRGYCSYAYSVRHSFSPHHLFDPEEADQDLQRYVEEELAANDTESVLLFDGGDHQEWDRDVYSVLKRRTELPYEGVEIVHSTLDAYLDDLVSQQEQIREHAEGELRDPGRECAPYDSQWLIPGVLSSRVWIKQANAACQTLLTRWAEPFGAIAQRAAGWPDQQGYLDVAWRWLLQNHPHDSICGCSIDAVHEDMQYRFRQCQQIGERLTVEANRKLAAAVAGEVGAGELRVAVFNPLSRPLDEVVDLTLHTPTDWAAFNEFFGFEPKPAFRIYDAAGRETPYQRVAQAMRQGKTRLRDVRFPERYYTNDITVSLRLAIPALGYTTLTVRQGEPNAPTRYPALPGLATSERSMANGRLAVTIESNGALTLTCLRTGQVYSRLLTFDECADIGDGWYHGQAVNDQQFVSTTSRADVALVCNGPLKTTFRVRMVMSVPAHFDFQRMERSTAFTELILDNLITLRAGAERLEIETTVHNTARDHRLRVLFPTGVAANTYMADTPFDAVERPIALREDNHLYRELEVETRPQQTWTAVGDVTRGLAVISEGLMESAVRDLPERPIALTLLRGTQRTVMTDGEPEGELIGPWRFRYWLAPFCGAVDVLRLSHLGEQLAAGLRDVQLQSEDLDLHRGSSALPTEAGLLSVSGPGVVTSAHQVGDAFEVRLYNPTGSAGMVRLQLGTLAGTASPGGALPWSQVQRVNLESAPLGPVEPLGGGGCTLTLSPKQIVTLAIR